MIKLNKNQQIIITVLVRAVTTEELRRDREVFKSVAISVHLEHDDFKFYVNRVLVEKRKKYQATKESKVLMLLL